MSDEINKVNPSKADMLELLDALRGEAHAGRLKILLFGLADPRAPDNMIIDAFGPHDVLEIACRKQVEEIACVAEQFNPDLAKAIRSGIESIGGKTH